MCGLMGDLTPGALQRHFLLPFQHFHQRCEPPNRFIRTSLFRRFLYDPNHTPALASSSYQWLNSLLINAASMPHLF